MRRRREPLLSWRQPTKKSWQMISLTSGIASCSTMHHCRRLLYRPLLQQRRLVSRLAEFQECPFLWQDVNSLSHSRCLVAGPTNVPGTPRPTLTPSVSASKPKYLPVVRTEKSHLLTPILGRVSDESRMRGGNHNRLRDESFSRFPEWTRL